MRLTCPAQRSARPDGDFVAGEGSGWRNANGCRADPTSPRRANLETLRAPVVRLVEAYRLEGGGATLTSGADRQTASPSYGPGPEMMPE